ncbi:MAG: BON domain-containing protein [Myxococcales bacterium]
MRLRLSALLSLTAIAACSNTSNQSTAKDPTYVAATANPAPEPSMTPASLERTEPSSSTSLPDTRRSTSAPAVAANDPKLGDTKSRERAANAPEPPHDATTSAPEPARPAVAPDNTKVNQRDTNSAALTPLDQSNDKTDLKITQQIRQAVMADGSLSFTAKNVKIITQGGKVTLRGPVNNEQERSNIEAAARKVAGVTEVDNQLEVKK